jgi:hypothetical protein
VTSPQSATSAAFRAENEPLAQHAELAAAELVAVAIGAVQHALAPALPEARDRRQFVAHAGREQEASCPVLVAVSIGDAETTPFGFRLARPRIPPGDGRIGEKLSLRLGDDRRRLAPVLAEKTVGMAGEAVTSLAFVDHQDAAARPRQLQAG